MSPEIVMVLVGIVWGLGKGFAIVCPGHLHYLATAWHVF
jgi:hypothetical protein